MLMHIGLAMLTEMLIDLRSCWNYQGHRIIGLMDWVLFFNSRDWIEQYLINQSFSLSIMTLRKQPYIFSDDDITLIKVGHIQIFERLRQRGVSIATFILKTGTSNMMQESCTKFGCSFWKEQNIVVILLQARHGLIFNDASLFWAFYQF